MLKILTRLLLKNRYIFRQSKQFFDEIKTEIATSRLHDSAVGECSLIESRPSLLPGQRFNLFIPALSIKHVFGGIATALDIFHTLTSGMENVRILLTDESNFDRTSNPAFSNWKIGAMDDVDQPGRWIIPLGNRYEKTLAVTAEDTFIASAWWTAIIVKHIRQWQMKSFNRPETRKYVYLIQDYEPGFYSWSSRYALAQSTYCETSGMIAVFNTSILYSYFCDEGYRFEHAFSFEPKLNRKLATYLAQLNSAEKEKRILVYGRPGTARNAFELVVMGLREWIRFDSTATGWSIVSVGEPHGDVDLGEGMTMRSLGKLSLEGYAQELLRSSIGLSLMISPHPSYPPLEMAAFGLKVLTNGYGAKDLSKVNPGITSLSNLSPQTIASTLAKLATISPQRSEKSAPDSKFWEEYMNGDTDLSELKNSILDLLALNQPAQAI